MYTECNHNRRGYSTFSHKFFCVAYYFSGPVLGLAVAQYARSSSRVLQVLYCISMSRCVKAPVRDGIECSEECEASHPLLTDERNSQASAALIRCLRVPLRARMIPQVSVMQTRNLDSDKQNLPSAHQSKCNTTVASHDSKQHHHWAPHTTSKECIC